MGENIAEIIRNVGVMARIDLRGYQRKDVDDLLKRKRLLHIGSPGIGKSVIASRAVEEAAAFPCLITCPGYLIDQWKDHLLSEGHPEHEILVAATVATRDGRIKTIGPEEKRQLLQRARDEKVKWILGNHEMLRLPARKREKSVDQIWHDTQKAQGWVPQGESSDFGPAEKPDSPTRRVAQRYDVHKGNFVSVICDELHRFRGHRAQQYRGLYSVASRSRCQMVIGLTATPIYRDVGDLYAQLRLLDPRAFTSYHRFVAQHAVVEHDDWGDHIVGARPSAKHILSQYAISRDYADPEVQIDIPPVIPRTIRTTLTAASHRAYHGARKEFVGTGNYLPALRRITAQDPAKLTALDDLLVDIGDRGFIVFTYYRETAIALSRRLGLPVALGGQKGNTQLAKSVGPRLGLDVHQAAVSPTRVHSGGPDDVVLRAVDRPPLGLVATIDCLQEGIDLSHLRSVIYYELDFLPGKLKQSMMRVQRFRPDGTSDPVLVYYLLARDTVDAHIYSVASQRGATIDEITRMEMAS